MYLDEYHHIMLRNVKTTPVMQQRSAIQHCTSCHDCPFFLLQQAFEANGYFENDIFFVF